MAARLNPDASRAPGPDTGSARPSRPLFLHLLLSEVVGKDKVVRRQTLDTDRLTAPLPSVRATCAGDGRERDAALSSLSLSFRPSQNVSHRDDE